MVKKTTPAAGRKAAASAGRKAASSADSNRPLVAAILSLVIPGAGQWYLEDMERAKTYFIYFVGLWIGALVLLTLSFGICLPVFFVPVLFAIAAAADAYYEASGEDDKRLLKKYIP